MNIKSFIKTDYGFRPVNLEVVLVPGVSQIQILGLADQVIKESSKRIVSALRHQKFRMPPGKQALVNLQPFDQKKTSQGLDLAIAIGILLESKQLELPDFNLDCDYVYGSLTLKGEIEAPEDLSLLNYENFEKKVLTGKNNKTWRFQVVEAESLSTLPDASVKLSSQSEFQCQKHSIDTDIFFDPRLARLMTVVASGEHPMLIAGHAGSGKTTMVENLGRVLSAPVDKTFLEAKKYWRLAGRELHNRPIVQPHHSSTPLAVIGGGRPLRFGEISLAHGGALILDELLEFHPQVQSALREPMEKGLIYLSRAGSRGQFPADCLVLATTNLCPCGNFQPGATYNCQCSSLRLRNYIEKLTGPFLDRFAIFHLFEKSEFDLGVSVFTIRDEVEKVREFQWSEREQKRPNQKLALVDLYKQVDAEISEALIPHSKSHRRRQSLLRVARTLADMDLSPRIKQVHLEEAQAWTASDIYKLERFRMDDFAMRQSL